MARGSGKAGAPTVRAGRTRSARGACTAAWLAGQLEAWFLANARALPWREVDPATGRRDPYRSLVSELMLQQTQVSRVLEKFAGFVGAFPDAGALARAEEQAVLAAWSGLGYYRRARLLHAAAKEIVARHGGSVPQAMVELRALPGVGRYTAGAIASICFGAAAPIVDGNVSRVLLRVHGKELASDDAEAVAWCWERAEELARAAANPGVANEGLMELGAVVCTPSAPKCGVCPLRSRCVARREGLQDRIPRPKKASVPRELFVATIVAERRDGAVLLERRPEKGMWAGMWQTPSLERADREATEGELSTLLGRGGASAKTTAIERWGAFTHQTTHRTLRFSVWRASGARATAGRRWVKDSERDTYPLSNATKRVLAIASANG